MKITALEIDGYGTWSGLKVQQFSDGMNVLYGPNEAGKTTLLCFVRSMLYGFSPERRRYLPPLRGGRPGGWIELCGPSGRFQIARHDDAGGQPGNEELALTAADGTRQGEHMLKVLLSNIDEGIFSNIFAVGLREMQELGTLSDTAAAEFLYNLTAGVDRVSLVDVLRELETSRNRILDRNGGPCQVVQLLAEREKLRQEIEPCDDLMHRYGHLAGQRLQLDRDIARREEEKNHADHEARVVELAIALGERWRRRAAMDDELAALGPQSPMPEDAIRRLDALNGRIRKRRRQLDQLRRQRRELRGEGAALAVSEALRRQAPRIEAMQEQLPWIGTLQTQAAGLEKEIADLSAAVAAEHKRLGLEDQDGPVRPAVAFRAHARHVAIGQPGDTPLPAAARRGAAGRRGGRGVGRYDRVANPIRLEHPAGPGIARRHRPGRQPRRRAPPPAPTRPATRPDGRQPARTRSGRAGACWSAGCRRSGRWPDWERSSCWASCW